MLQVLSEDEKRQATNVNRGLRRRDQASCGRHVPPVVERAAPGPASLAALRAFRAAGSDPGLSHSAVPRGRQVKEKWRGALLLTILPIGARRLIHLGRVPRALRDARGAAVEGEDGGVLGQRSGRVVLRHLQARADRVGVLADPRSGTHATVHWLEAIYNRQRRHSASTCEVRSTTGSVTGIAAQRLNSGVYPAGARPPGPWGGAVEGEADQGDTDQAWANVRGGAPSPGRRPWRRAWRRWLRRRCGWRSRLAPRRRQRPR